MLPPLPRCSGWASSSLISPSRNSLPRKRCRVGLHIVLFEACSAFTHVAARTLAPSPICDQLHRRLQPFRHLHDCSGCFRLERSPGGARTHWKAPPSHGAHVDRTFAECGREGRSWEFLPFGRRTPRHGSGDQAVSRETDPPLSRPSRASVRARTRISSNLPGQVVKTFGRCERSCDRKPPLPFVWFAWHNA